MRFVPSLFVDNWHKQIEIIVEGRSPITDDHDFNTSFPFNNTLDYTKQYITSKKERAVPGVADERLMKLIQRSERKDVALAACMHLLSSQAIRTLVVRDFARLDAKLYLRLLLLAHHGNPNAVDEEEFTRAKALLIAFNLDRPGLLGDEQFLRALAEIAFKTPVPKTSLVYSTLQTAIVTACPKFNNELFEQQYDRQWHRCWLLVSWISRVVREAQQIPAEHLNPVELFDNNFSSWRMWAVWQPLCSKTVSTKTVDAQREALWDFLELEGPDDQFQPRGNVCERMLSQDLEMVSNSLARAGNFDFSLIRGTEEEAKEMLRRLHKCTSHAVVTHFLHIDLLTTLCLKKAITTDALEIMEALEAAEDLEVTSNCLDLLRTQADRIQYQKIARNLLPLLFRSNCEKVKTSPVGKMVVVCLMQVIRELQQNLQTAWIENDSTTAAIFELQLRSEIAYMRTSATDLTWLSNIVDEKFMKLINFCPRDQDITILQQMRNDVYQMPGISVHSLTLNINKYLQDLLLEHGLLDEERKAMLQALMCFWGKAGTKTSRPLAVLLAGGKGNFRRDCISQLHLLTEVDISALMGIMLDWAKDSVGQDKACEDLAKFLALRAGGTVSTRDATIITAWKPVLYRMLRARGLSLVENAPQNMKVKRYVTFLKNIQTIYGDKVVWNPKLSPAIMNPSLHVWTDRLATHLSVLRRLEEEAQGLSAIRCFLAGNDQWILEGILCHLALEDCWVGKTPMYEASYGISSLLSHDPSNAQEVYDVLCSVFQMSLGGATACRRLLDLFQQGQIELASLFLPCWLQDCTWSENDHMGLKDMARLLKIDSNKPTTVSEETLLALVNNIDARYSELLVEAKRLDYMRVGLKTRDCDGLAHLLDESMIEDATAMEDALAQLPVELLNVVEMVNDSEVEMLFPLNDLTLLQRAALGIGNAQSLIIRLYIGDYGSQPKFCIHLDNEPKLDSHDVHFQWVVFTTTRAPEQPICHGGVTPVTYQLARMLSRYLIGGFKDLLSIHTLVSTSLKTMGAACIICGTHHGASLRKATICDAWECINIFSRAPIEIRLADIRQDPMAVDMLLTMIHSAITSGYHNLLPNCPLDKDTCLEILKTLPSMATQSKSKRFTKIRNLHAGKAEQFLTWACCSFRGFLSSATGKLRIPSLPPGTLQFVLASAAPMKELTFLSEFSVNTQQSRVVFHGTSLDRLYLILHQGLKSMSGTPLQAYGAAAGPGIYLAEEPSTSWAYADRKAATRPNWANSAIKNGRVLLGCELTGPSTSTGRAGVHVVQKEGSVMVRYIFVVPTNAVTLPISGHVSPAMMSVFNSLRSGAL